MNSGLRMLGVGVVAGFAILGVILLALLAAGRLTWSQPVYTPAPVPSVFCPSGQHVTGVSASGQPDCAPGH